MPLLTFGRRIPVAVAGALLLALGSAALAADPTPAPSAPTRQMREKMATLHEQMAACLRSDKPIDECRAAMLKHCQRMMGGKECSRMMGRGGMMCMGGRMNGMDRGMQNRMTSRPPSSPPK